MGDPTGACPLKPSSFQFAGETLWLDPRRAVWWPRGSAVLVADLHLGKARILRERGIPVPEGTTCADLQRLAAVLEALRPKRLLILGDLVHGRPQPGQPWLEHWLDFRRRHRALEIAAVRGNHDHRLDFSAMAIEDWGSCADLGPFRIRHDPSSERLPVLSGHVHPVAKIRLGRLSARFPCLWLRPEQAVLPAFTALAGGHPVRAGARERLLLCLEDQVLPWPPGEERDQSTRARTALR